jgi:hypothetical protein
MTGILWLVWFEENAQAAPSDTLRAAISRYTEKYGSSPNRVRVPLDWPKTEAIEGLFVERSRYILHRHVHLAFDTSFGKEN